MEPYMANPAMLTVGSSNNNTMDHVHQSTLLDLLMQQQLQGDTGLRLSFHPTLLQKISFLNNPYHYAAVTGNTALALLLWSQQRIPIGASIPIAEFSAAGPTNSHTPWVKMLDVSPREAALLAGHAETAAALELMEAGVPLHWSSATHHLQPTAFKQQTRKQMDCLCRSGLLTSLPGPARAAAVAAVMANLVAQHDPWACLPHRLRSCSSYWTEVDSVLHQAVGILFQAQIRKDGTGVAMALPNYQFRLGGAARQALHRRGVARLISLVGAVSSIALLSLVKRNRQTRNSSLAAYASLLSMLSIPGAMLVGHCLALLAL